MGKFCTRFTVNWLVVGAIALVAWMGWVTISLVNAVNTNNEQKEAITSLSGRVDYLRDSLWGYFSTLK